MSDLRVKYQTFPTPTRQCIHCAEGARLLNASRRRKLATLSRRAEYLRGVANEHQDDPGTAYDLAEIAALEFAIKTIEAHYDGDVQ